MSPPRLSHASNGVASSNNSNRSRGMNAQAGGQRKPASWMLWAAEIGSPSCEENTGLSIRAINAVSRMGKSSYASALQLPLA